MFALEDTESGGVLGTSQIISQERIAHSTAKTVTALLAENAVGFRSEWTAGSRIGQIGQDRFNG